MVSQDAGPTEIKGSSIHPSSFPLPSIYLLLHGYVDPVPSRHYFPFVQRIRSNGPWPPELGGSQMRCRTLDHPRWPISRRRVHDATRLGGCCWREAHPPSVCAKDPRANGMYHHGDSPYDMVLIMFPALGDRSVRGGKADIDARTSSDTVEYGDSSVR